MIVRNLGVISQARLQPGPGLTVITGETGAGKTILVGALRLLLGAGARSDLVGPFGEEATVEGRFVTGSGDEIVAGRRLSRAGRSRAYLDGAMASAAGLDEATDGLVEIVAQHDQLSLTKPGEVRGLIDASLDEEGREVLRSYREAWERLRGLRADREALGGDRPTLERELALLRHQAEEIAQAGVRPGEDEELDVRLARLRNADRLVEHLGNGGVALDGGREQLGRAVGEVRKAAALDPTLDEIAERLGFLEAEAGEVAGALRRMAEEIEADPVELEAAERRRHQLSDLRRRYGPELEAVIEFGRSATERADFLAGLLGRADDIEAELTDAMAEVETIGRALTDHRHRAGRHLCELALGHLRDLGFSDPRLVVELQPTEPGPYGVDSPRLSFASDSRLAPGDISKVASGGELSRLVLALRLAGGAVAAPVLVFDEIDAGVGGATALAIGRKLAALAAEHQVLVVTHLPQVAAFAQVHYVVRRGEEEAGVTMVEEEERVEELARMLAGLPDSQRGRDAAEELWALAREG